MKKPCSAASALSGQSDSGFHTQPLNQRLRLVVLLQHDNPDSPYWTASNIQYLPYTPAMHYRVEIQRQAGRKLAQPLVVFGQLVSYTRAFGDRSVVMLQLTDTGSVQDIPTLYSPTVARVTHEGLLLTGMERTADDAWVAQTWWCAYSTAEAARAASQHQPTKR